MTCTTERHVWEWVSTSGNVTLPVPPGLHCVCGAITPEDAGPQPDEMVRLQMALDAAESEIERLRGEPSIAECGCPVKRVSMIYHTRECSTKRMLADLPLPDDID